MKPHIESTSLGVRLTFDKKEPGPNWIFIPGGPGMGSESLLSLTKHLPLKGSLIRLDLPNDGRNRQNSPIDLKTWQTALLDAVKGFKHVILVGHSFGAMLIQTMPALEPLLKGVVFITSGPNNTWYKTFAARAQHQNLPNVSGLRKAFLENPSDESYRHYMIHCLPYYFLPKGMIEGGRLFKSLPYHHKPYLWALEHFHPVSKANWVPKIPCLIINAENDYVVTDNPFHQPAYQAKNIDQVVIPKAGHFPWIENLPEVKQAFLNFEKKLS